MAARARGLSRRGLLGLGAGASVLAGCGGHDATPAPSSAGAAPAKRVRYGADPSQYGDLRLPSRTPRGTVVLLHGGYWLAQYGADQLVPMAQRLTAEGYATWNVEYRRTGIGGGFPETFEDVATAIDRLTELTLTANVVLLGHSAGGHLAAWAASRTAKTPGGVSQVHPVGVVSLSGVLDLTLAATAPGSGPNVTALMGGTPDRLAPQYAVADPALLVPATCPVEAVHAAEDQVVPLVQATSYVAKAEAASGRAELVTVPGNHFSLIDPRAASFATIDQLVSAAVGSSR